MRDFRDAKVMAHALRDALQAKAVESTHSECLELIAKAFGYQSWNILAAKIEAVRPPGVDAPPLAPAAAQDPAPPKELHCSFCRKSQHAVEVLVAGPTVFICDECVALCNGIIEDKKIGSLLKADEERGNQGYPATIDYLRARSAADLASCVERSRTGAERYRLELHLLEGILAMRDGEAPADELSASPRFAQLKDKTREDLLALRQFAEREVEGYEQALRIAVAVLDPRTL